MRRCLLLALACAATATALAVPAKPTPFEFTQPDGSVVTVTLRGDEYSHWYQTADGKILINRDDALYYAKLGAAGKVESTSILATKALSAADAMAVAAIDQAKVGDAIVAHGLQMRQKRHAKPAAATSASSQANAPQDSYGVGLFPGTHFPATGEQKGIVILVNYTDVKFSTSNPLDYFSRLMNQEGFSDYNATGSARDYFMQNSSNQFIPTFDVYGPVELPHNMAYYGGNDWGGNDKNPEQMAIEACQILDSTVDFSQYDRDGDGKIDNVYIFYAGRGEASGGGSNTVWPHSWEISSSGAGTFYFDGKKLDHYACSNEWQGSKPDGIGTFVHEFSHVMGLPDIYATSYTSAFTPGSYCVMDQGSYNGDSRTPPCYGAFERNAMGWLKPEILTLASGAKDLKDISNNEACLIPTSSANEFFLVENRQQKGWDRYIPGHGMLIWHIDYKSNIWNQNTVNNDANHQYVDIEEADNNRSESTRAGDPFPGTSKKTEFTKETTPALKTWNGVGLDTDIRNIYENTSTGIVSFSVGEMQIDPPAAVEAKEATEVGSYAFTANWTKSPTATSYIIEVKAEDGTYPGQWKLKNVGDVTSVKVDKLKPSTTYTYKVWASLMGIDSNVSNAVTVTTELPPITEYQVEALDADNVTESAFTAHWNLLDRASDYSIDVTLTRPQSATQINATFDRGIADLPEGWTTSAVFTFSTPENCGENPSALRFHQVGYLQTCEYELPIKSLSFWYKGVSTNLTNQLSVKGRVRDTDNWVEFATLNITNGASIYMNSTVSDTCDICAIRIEYIENYHQGSLSIDDVYVKWGDDDVEPEYLDGYKAFATGNVSECIVSGVQPETDYYYVVTGLDGERKSMPSKAVKVTTMQSSIGSIESSGKGISVNGNIISADGDIEIFTIDGRLVYSGQGNVIVAPGAYIIRHAGHASKTLIQ